MMKNLCILICFILVLETRGFPDKRAEGHKKGKRPSGTNFLKRVLENVIDRARKGLATPGDKEVLLYLSRVPFLKDRICGKIPTASVKQSQSSTLPTTLTTESSTFNALDEDSSKSLTKSQSDKPREKTATKSSLVGKQSKIPASSRPSNTLKASTPNLRHPSTAAKKQSSVVETDSMDTVLYIRTKRDLQDRENSEPDENTEMLNQHDSWHNEEPSEEGNPLETREDNSLDDKELEAIVGEENPESSFNSKDFQNGNHPTGGETRNIDIETKDFEINHETTDTFNANEYSENEKTTKDMEESFNEKVNRW